jgi:hypothetical protein
VLVRRLAAYLLWIPGLFAVIAAVILPVVSSCPSRRGRVAGSWPQIGCGQVRAAGAVRDEPVHVHGAGAPGPAGLALFGASALLLVQAGGPSG